MNTVDRLAHLISGAAAQLILAHHADATEVRLRTNRPVQIVWPEGNALAGDAVPPDRLREIVSALMDHSFYAREAELAQGFFTMEDGSRVGVCGRFSPEAGGWRMTDVGSACVRLARERRGCADALMPHIRAKDALRSLLLLSRPALGKTTLLRDVARQLSEGGFRVGVADDRHELAACRTGVPTLDVGPRTDVMDGCPKPEAIRLMIRALSPDAIVADEIGSEADARALADAARCGVAFVASAHAESLEAALKRPWLKAVIEGGAVSRIALLGDRPGSVRALHAPGEANAWKRA